MNKLQSDRRTSQERSERKRVAEAPEVAPTVPRARHGEKTGAELAEERSPAKGNMGQQNAHRTQGRARALSALDRVRKVAKEDKNAKFTALFHHITIDALDEAFFSMKKKAAAGVDKMTWWEYERDHERKLKDLHARLQRGAYRAKPSRRVLIPKPDGRQRPLGIAALEDKIVQRAVAQVLNAVYEVDFMGFSYGFRPGRSQHNALDALCVSLYTEPVNWVLDADIRGFFDAVDHEWLITFIRHRIADKRILRLIQKWLRAGVVENGRRRPTEVGTPQGATISPLLSNIYLHYVLDLWTHQWRNRHAKGAVTIVRYADDFVVGFQYCSDAEMFQRDLAARLRKFKLELHPDKTRLIEFGRFAAQNRAERGAGRPEIFTFLGFQHICSETKKGKYMVRRRTIPKRMQTTLKAIHKTLLRLRDLPAAHVGKWLGAVLRGYFAYFAVPTNMHSMGSFRDQVIRHWRHSLRRRSQKDGTTWARMRHLCVRWLPYATVQHPWPSERLRVTT